VSETATTAVADKAMTVSAECPVRVNEDTGDLALFIKGGNYSPDWYDVPQGVIGYLIYLYHNGLEEFLIDRAEKYQKVNGEKYKDSFTKIEDVYSRGDDFKIEFYGEDYRCGCTDSYTETIPLSVLLDPDLENQKRAYEARQAELKRQEALRREREAEEAKRRQEAQERATYEKLKAKYEGGATQ
jgi:hypothetical protein